MDVCSPSFYFCSFVSKEIRRKLKQAFRELACVYQQISFLYFQMDLVNIIKALPTDSKHHCWLILATSRLNFWECWELNLKWLGGKRGHFICPLNNKYLLMQAWKSTFSFSTPRQSPLSSHYCLLHLLNVNHRQLKKLTFNKANFFPWCLLGWS